jgi:hypothetical protein
MFDFLKSKPETKPLNSTSVGVAIEAAILLWDIELKNGGIYTHPDQIDLTVKAVAKRSGFNLENKNLLFYTNTLVMGFLVDQKFINDLLNRFKKNGAIGTLTLEDERKIDKIISNVTGQ